MNEFFLMDVWRGREERRDKIRDWNGRGGKEKKGKGRDKLRIDDRIVKMKRLGLLGIGVEENGAENKGDYFEVSVSENLYICYFKF